MSIFFTEKKKTEVDRDPDVSEYNEDEDENDDNLFSSIVGSKNANARKKRFVEVE